MSQTTVSRVLTLSNTSGLLDPRGKAEENGSQHHCQPRNKSDECLTAVIAGKLDADPHLSSRKLAKSLGIAVSRFVDT
jgi:hypothetical protein